MLVLYFGKNVAMAKLKIHSTKLYAFTILSEDTNLTTHATKYLSLLLERLNAEYKCLSKMT